MLPVVVRPEARAEFDEAFDWYEARQPGLGVDFASRVQEVIRSITESPLRYAEVAPTVHRATMKRFPYALFYQIEATQVVVLAVFHGKRDPGVWQDRR